MTTLSASSAPTLARSDSADALYRRIAWRLLPLLFVCYIAAYLDRVNIGFAKLQMQGALHFSDAVYGLGAGVFFIGYFLFEVPSNVLLTRIGARNWIARILVTWGLLSAATYVVNSEGSFYLLRFLLGAAEAGFFPGVVLYFTYWFPAQRRSRSLSIFLIAIPLSGIVGGIASGWILKGMAGVHGMAGWQWMFILQGLPTCLLGVLVWFFLDNGPDSAKWLSKEEKQYVKAQLASEAGRAHEMSVLRVLFHPGVLLLSLVYFCLVAGLYGVSFWLPTILKGMGITDPLNVGLVSAVPWTLSIFAMYFAARSADRRLEYRRHVAVAALVAAAGLAMSAAAGSNRGVALVGLAVGMMGIMATLPVFWGLPTRMLKGVAAAAGIAFVNSCGNLSGFVAPFVIGLIKDATGSTTNGVYALAGTLAVGALAVLVTRSHSD